LCEEPGVLREFAVGEWLDVPPRPSQPLCASYEIFRMRNLIRHYPRSAAPLSDLPASTLEALRSDADMFLRLCTLAARALGEVHSRGIAHGDVRSQTVLCAGNCPSPVAHVLFAGFAAEARPMLDASEAGADKHALADALAALAVVISPAWTAEERNAVRDLMADLRSGTLPGVPAARVIDFAEPIPGVSRSQRFFFQLGVDVALSCLVDAPCKQQVFRAAQGPTSEGINCPSLSELGQSGGHRHPAGSASFQTGSVTIRTWSEGPINERWARQLVMATLFAERLEKGSPKSVAGAAACLARGVDLRKGETWQWEGANTRCVLSSFLRSPIAAVTILNALQTVRALENNGAPLLSRSGSPSAAFAAWLDEQTWGKSPSLRSDFHQSPSLRSDFHHTASYIASVRFAAMQPDESTQRARPARTKAGTPRLPMTIPVMRSKPVGMAKLWEDGATPSESKGSGWREPNARSRPAKEERVVEVRAGSTECSRVPQGQRRTLTPSGDLGATPSLAMALRVTPSEAKGSRWDPRNACTGWLASAEGAKPAGWLASAEGAKPAGWLASAEGAKPAAKEFGPTPDDLKGSGQDWALEGPGLEPPSEAPEWSGRTPSPQGDGVRRIARARRAKGNTPAALTSPPFQSAESSESTQQPSVLCDAFCTLLSAFGMPAADEPHADEALCL